MAIPLLVVTSDSDFGELLRVSLEETKQFSALVVDQAEKADAYVRKTNCSLAFLDASESDMEVLQAGNTLRQANPSISFVIISVDGARSTLEELEPIGYLSKPFSLPDLQALMSELFPPFQEQTLKVEFSSAVDGITVDVDKEPVFSNDVNRAAQHLMRLTLESSAQAALITQNDALWAYAGELSQSAARELAGTVTRYWDRHGESDLVRFVRLKATNADHMLYATRLSDDLVLALIFDAKTPFSTIRMQAGQLVRLLSIESLAEENEAEDESVPEASLTDILTDVPPPNPPKGHPPVAPDHSHGSSPTVPLPSDRMTRASHETSPAIPIKPMLFADEAERKVEVDSEESFHERKTIVPETPVKKARKRSLSEPGEIRPRPITEVTRKLVLEPVSPSVYNLTYACLLIPRFTQHLLTGDVAGRISEWVPEICVAFGWRLEHISLRPDYLQWIVNVPPATSPGYLMRILRQHTSNKIFEEFPRFKKENLSGDFWAPGYLIMGGTQSPPAQLIKEFIQKTRQRQGISTSNK